MNFFTTLKAFWKIISRKISVGGLCISNSSVQYVRVEDGALISYGIRLEPGILKSGRLLDVARFNGSLRALHEQIFPGKPKTALKVVVALPADLVYTQSFSVPSLEREKIEESVKLNLQMLSPVSAENVHMSSQILKEEFDHVDVLGAFVEREKVEELRQALISNRFAPVIFEFPALSLSRLLAGYLGGQNEAALLIRVSSDGIDFLINRNKFLYFDYFRSWQSIQGDDREISKLFFEQVITAETQKVINFSLSRFKEAPKKAFVIAPGYENVIQEIVERNLDVKVMPLQLSNYSVGPAWNVALGSALRAVGGYENDMSIALGTPSFFEVFYEEKLVNLIKTWRAAAAGVMALFILIFAASLVFLTNQSKILASQLENIKSQLSQENFLAIAAKVKNFNALVAGARKAKESEKPWLPLLEELKKIADANGISVERFDAGSFGGSISVGARGPDHSSVTRFKNLLAADSRFFNVDLPLARITAQGDNAVSFTVTFQVREPFTWFLGIKTEN